MVHQPFSLTTFWVRIKLTVLMVVGIDYTAPIRMLSFLDDVS